MRQDQTILVNLSGRGDKDMHTVAAREGIDPMSRIASDVSRPSRPRGAPR